MCLARSWGSNLYGNRLASSLSQQACQRVSAITARGNRGVSASWGGLAEPRAADRIGGKGSSGSENYKPGFGCAFSMSRKPWRVVSFRSDVEYSLAENTAVAA